MTRHWSGARPATNRALNDMTVTPPRIQDLIASIETARAGLLDDARPIAVERVHARGRLSARERAPRLIDEGSFRASGAPWTPEQDDDGPEASARARAETPAERVPLRS